MGWPVHPAAVAGGRGERRGRPGPRGRGLQCRVLVPAAGRDRGLAARHRVGAAGRSAALHARAGRGPARAPRAAHLGGRTGLRRAGPDRAAPGLRPAAHGRAGRGARGGVAAPRRLGDGGGSGRSGPGRRAVPLGLFSREAVRLLPHRLAFGSEPGTGAGGLPQLRRRVRPPRASGFRAVHRAGAIGAGAVRADRPR